MEFLSARLFGVRSFQMFAPITPGLESPSKRTTGKVDAQSAHIFVGAPKDIVDFMSTALGSML